MSSVYSSPCCCCLHRVGWICDPQLWQNLQQNVKACLYFWWSENSRPWEVDKVWHQLIIKDIHWLILHYLQNWFSCGDNWKEASPEKYLEALRLKLRILFLFCLVLNVCKLYKFVFICYSYKCCLWTMKANIMNGRLLNIHRMLRKKPIDSSTLSEDFKKVKFSISIPGSVEFISDFSTRPCVGICIVMLQCFRQRNYDYQEACKEK